MYEPFYMRRIKPKICFLHTFENVIFNLKSTFFNLGPDIITIVFDLIRLK